MTRQDLTKTIEWLREYVFRMEDRDDWEKLSEPVGKLKQTIRELEDQLNAL